MFFFKAVKGGWGRYILSITLDDDANGVTLNTYELSSNWAMSVTQKSSFMRDVWISGA